MGQQMWSSTGTWLPHDWLLNWLYHTSGAQLLIMYVHMHSHE
jgi:hypothetical protein